MSKIIPIEKRKAPLNGKAWCEWMACLDCPGGGETIYFKNEYEAAVYNADPDAWAARYFGFGSVLDYREWIRLNGEALCGERTRSGKLCRNCIPGCGQVMDAAEWRARHRKQPCKVHARRADSAKL